MGLYKAFTMSDQYKYCFVCVCFISHFPFFGLFSHSSSVFIHPVFRYLDCMFRRAYALVAIQYMFCWNFVSSFACCGGLVDILQLMEWYKQSFVNLTYIVSSAIQQVSHLYPQPLLQIDNGVWSHCASLICKTHLVYPAFQSLPAAFEYSLGLSYSSLCLHRRQWSFL